MSKPLKTVISRRTAVGLSLAAAGAAIASPAVAQSQPALKWRMVTSYPKSLDTLDGGCRLVAKIVSDLTDGQFQIEVFAAGEIVPALGVVDAVQNGTVEMGHSASYYYVGKDPALAFDTCLPFGLNARQHIAWMTHGGGAALVQEVFSNYNIRVFPCGNTGAQMAGWFRKEIKTVDDFKGLKFRTGGLAGQVLAKLGVVTQQIGAADIYPALERGTIDAAEWVGPRDDEKLGLQKVAQYYYAPGWAEGSAQVSLYVGQNHFDKLPANYKAAIETRDRDGQFVDAREIRPRQSDGAEATGRGRRAGARLFEGHPERRLRRGRTDLCRAQRAESALQEAVSIRGTPIAARSRSGSASTSSASTALRRDATAADFYLPVWRQRKQPTGTTLQPDSHQE